MQKNGNDKYIINLISNLLASKQEDLGPRSSHSTSYEDMNFLAQKMYIFSFLCFTWMMTLHITTSSISLSNHIICHLQSGMYAGSVEPAWLHINACCLASSQA